MPAYFLFDNVEVTDPEALAEYASKTLPTVQAHGGQYVVKGGRTELKEGNLPLSSPVIIEFPDMASANAWYDSPEYAPLKAQRHGAGTFNATLIGSD